VLPVALAGSITPKVWTDRQGNARPVVDLVAHQVLTVYHVKRKRAATEGVRPASTSDDFCHEPQDG